MELGWILDDKLDIAVRGLMSRLGLFLMIVCWVLSELRSQVGWVHLRLLLLIKLLLSLHPLGRDHG